MTALFGPPSPDEMRASGFTADAIRRPRDGLALVMLCAFNGIDPDKAPRAWGYHPNPATQVAWERVAAVARQWIEHQGTDQ